MLIVTFILKADVLIRFVLRVDVSAVGPLELYMNVPADVRLERLFQVIIDVCVMCVITVCYNIYGTMAVSSVVICLYVVVC